MSIIGLILIAVAVSVDGFWGGFAFGLNRTKIPKLSLLIISSWSVLCTMITMLIGRFLTYHIPILAAKIAGAVLLIIIGFMALREGLRKKDEYRNRPKTDDTKPGFKDVFRILNNPLLADVDNQNDIKPSEATLFGLAVSMDASVAAFTLALSGMSPFTTPFLFGLTHFLLIGAGNIIATRKLFNAVGIKFAIFPGLILMALGILRLL